MADCKAYYWTMTPSWFNMIIAEENQEEKLMPLVHKVIASIAIGVSEYAQRESIYGMDPTNWNVSVAPLASMPVMLSWIKSTNLKT
jgi:hypothetical protein